MSFQSKLRSFLLPLAAILIILALIFLPEIIGIKTFDEKSFENRYKDKETFSIKEDEVQAEREVYVEDQKTQSPLPEKKLNRGVGYWISETLSGKSTQATNTRDLDPARKTSSNKANKNKRGRKNKRTESKLKVVSEHLDNWNYIGTQLVQDKFRNAEEDAKYFYRDLKPEYKNSVAAVEKLIQILLILQSEPEHEYSPKEIIGKLEEADMSVTTALLKDLVSRSFLIRWNQFDLSEFYDSKRVISFKRVAAAGFEPRIQIAGVRYYLKKGAWQAEFANLDKIEVSFILLKDTLKSAKLLHNGQFVRNLKAKKDSRKKDWVQIVTSITKFSGLYTIQAEDVFGGKSFKSYQFDKGFSKFNLDQAITKKNKYIYTAEINDNFQNSVNFIDQHYWYIPDAEKRVTGAFPDGQFERF